MRHVKIRQGGQVKRFHTTTIIGEQTTGAHSWGVAQIILELWPDCSKALLVAALNHDVAEGFTGDIPSPAKWASNLFAEGIELLELRVESELGIRPQLTEQEQTQLRQADLLELMYFCVEQRNLGNRYMLDIFNKAKQALFQITGGGVDNDIGKFISNMENTLSPC